MEGWQVNQYMILRKLGEGGMGEVYLAEDKSLGRKIAVKFLSPSLENDEVARKRFVREAKAAAALDNPFICRVYDVAQVEGRQFIAMEYVEGVTLKEELKKGPLPLERALRLAAEVAEALEVAHLKGFVHRDLKPSNIMLSSRGHARVVDFGLARRVPTLEVGRDQTATQLTGDSSTVGTLSYMSPEQLSGDTITTHSDIFSFGIVLYEMLSGVHPFRRATEIATAHAILGEEPVPLLDHADRVPPSLVRMIHGMLEKEPSKRIQSISEVRATLSRLQRGLPVRWTDRFARWHIMGLAVVLALFFAALMFLVLRLPQPASLQPSLRQLTFDSGSVFGPSWSPDGTFIAYTSNSSGNFDIWVKQVGGGPAIQVTKSPADDTNPDWSPDGSKIVFRSTREGGGIYLIPALGGNARRISSTGYQPKWSPDGEYILITTEPGIGHFEGRWSPVRVITPNGELVKSLALPNFQVGFAGWFPDGRVSLLGMNQERVVDFRTVTVEGDQAVKSEFPRKLQQQISEGSFVPLQFAWSPVPDDYLYLMAVSGGAPDLFRVRVDRESLRWLTLPEPLTRSSTVEYGMALSRDGKNLAFTPGTTRTGIWLFPFDASAGALVGKGELVSPGGMNATRPDISTKTGSQLLFRVFSPEGVELWAKSLGGDEETLVARGPVSGARSSQEGTWLCYERGEREGVRFVLRKPSGEETDLTSPLRGSIALSGFSADGSWILASLPTKEGEEHAEIVKLPIAKAPRAEEHARKVASHPELNLWQPRSSPDDRWIAFVAIRRTDPRGTADIYVTPSSGGEWIPITGGNRWNDKPRWSPDGKTIFFISDRGGYFNVWGQRFDSDRGRLHGEPFQVSDFHFPEVILSNVVELELALSQTRLGLPLTQVYSENIWVLENVDD